MIREKTSEYFKILKRDKKDWYEYFINDYLITNLKFINIYCNIENNLKEKFKNLTRPLVDTTYQEWNKARVQLKSDLNYLLDHIKLYTDYYEGNHKILFFGGVGENIFYYVEIPEFFYLGIDVVGYYKKYKNFSMHLPILFEILKRKFYNSDKDELKYIALKIIETSKRKINEFNNSYLPQKFYDFDYIKEKYNLKKSFDK